MSAEQPKELIQELSFEMVLKPNEFAVIGCRLDGTHSLGQEFFRLNKDDQQLQRLLVFRTSRSREVTPIVIDEFNSTKERVGKPIALQAGE